MYTKYVTVFDQIQAWLRSETGMNKEIPQLLENGELRFLHSSVYEGGMGNDVSMLG